MFPPLFTNYKFLRNKAPVFFLVSFLSPNSNKKTGALFRGFRYREICFYAPPLKGKSGQKSWTTFSSIFKICLLFRGFLFSIIFGWKNISKSFEKKVVQLFGIFWHFFLLRGHKRKTFPQTCFFVNVLQPIILKYVCPTNVTFVTVISWY